MGGNLPELTPIKLNLACGNKILPNYINCDLTNFYSDSPTQKPDVVCDIRTLPFDDNYADEILAVHIIEHFHLWEVGAVLNEWKRVLKPNGVLILECPDLNKILFWFTKIPIVPSLTIIGLYGDQRFKAPSMNHHWAWTPDTLSLMLKEAGFRELQCKAPEFHIPCRDMRIEGIK